jgi:hypothetical protein
MNAFLFGLARSRRLWGACAVALATAIPAAATAQSRSDSIDPGMTHDQVISRLGGPDEEAVSGSYDYMYYENGCGKKCGIDDLVILENGIVTDAVFRSKTRVFTGVSSSPKDLPPAPPLHYAPAPIQAAAPGESARWGIVFADPRTPVRPPLYVRIVPTHADSVKMQNSGSGSGITPAPAPPSATPPSATPPADSSTSASGVTRADTAARH